MMQTLTQEILFFDLIDFFFSLENCTSTKFLSPIDCVLFHFTIQIKNFTEPCKMNLFYLFVDRCTTVLLLREEWVCTFIRKTQTLLKRFKRQNFGTHRTRCWVKCNNKRSRKRDKYMCLRSDRSALNQLVNAYHSTRPNEFFVVHDRTKRRTKRIEKL